MEGLHPNTHKASSGLCPHGWRRGRPCLKSEGPKIIPSLQGPAAIYRETWRVNGQRRRCGKTLSVLSFVKVIYKYSEDTTVCYLLCIQGPQSPSGLQDCHSWEVLIVSPCAVTNITWCWSSRKKKFWEVDPYTFLSHYCTYLWEMKRAPASFRFFQGPSLLFHYTAVCKHINQMKLFHFNV